MDNCIWDKANGGKKHSCNDKGKLVITTYNASDCSDTGIEETSGTCSESADCICGIGSDCTVGVIKIYATSECTETPAAVDPYVMDTCIDGYKYVCEGDEFAVNLYSEPENCTGTATKTVIFPSNDATCVDWECKAADSSAKTIIVYINYMFGFVCLLFIILY
eukprot:771284_1